MNKILISGGIIAALVVYFIMTLVIFPQEFLSQSIVEPQPIQEIIIDKQIYRIRYSGADNILERFSITSSGPIVGNWNVNIESPEIFGQSASAQTELWLKVKYRAEHNRSFTVSSD